MEFVCYSFTVSVRYIFMYLRYRVGVLPPAKISRRYGILALLSEKVSIIRLQWLLK